jgi:hypothetical protein|tara:strand:- start:463 stop:735 length:273 start_codon:yes stop_codon:yes gene_type:complete
MKKKNNTIAKLPAWFDGVIYETGDTVVNPFTGVEFKLNGPELSMYDFIIGLQYVMEVAPKTVTPNQIKLFHKALAWFRTNNSEAYMALLD